MRHIFILLTFLFYVQSSAQELLWEKTIGGDDTDWIHHAFQNSSGNYIFSGYTHSSFSGEIDITNKGFSDFWILATNPAGTILWQTGFGGNQFDAIKKTIELTDGTYLLTGESYSGVSGDKTEGMNGFRDLWIVKLDASKNIAWQKTYGGIGAEDLSDVVQTNDGGYLIAANSYSSSGNNSTGLGQSDVWILKLDSNGNLEWQKSYGGEDYDSSPKIVKKTNGNFVLGASSASGVSDTKSEPSRGINDYWIFEIDPMGEIIWQKTYGGDNGDHLVDIKATADGGYIVGGDSASGVSGDRTVPNNGSTEFWILKLNSVGEIQWQEVYAGNDTDWLSSVTLSKDSGYILAGMSYSGVGGDKTEPNVGNRDYWILKISEDGTKCWDKTLGALGPDQPWSGFEDREGNYVLAGWSDSGASGDKTEPSRGGRDGWIIKINQPEIFPPVVNTPEPYKACDNNNDGFAEFDLSDLEEDIIGGQTDLEVSYYDENGNALPSPMPVKYINTTKTEQKITARVTRINNACASVTVEIILAVENNCEKPDKGGGKGPDFRLFFPRFFTPNGDGYNDNWGPLPTQVRNIRSVQIFDRYGKLLKELLPEETWNGEWNDIPMPVDDYWFTALDSNNDIIKGHFSLLR